MIRINLLPYRDAQKAAHRLRYKILVVVTIVISLGFTGGVFSLTGMQIDAQMQRNQILESENRVLDGQIKDIANLKSQRDNLLNRKQLVERLDEGRNDATHLFDQLIRQTPDGVYLTSVKQNGASLTLTGFASSGARVSLFMRQLGQSPFFTTPVLVEVKMDMTDGQRANAFTLTVQFKSHSGSLAGSNPSSVVPDSNAGEKS